MPKFRVSYTSYLIHDVVVKAASARNAEKIARRQLDRGYHHHSSEMWQDKWYAEPYIRPPLVNRHCLECGELRK